MTCPNCGCEMEHGRRKGGRIMIRKKTSQRHFAHCRLRMKKGLIFMLVLAMLVSIGNCFVPEVRAFDGNRYLLPVFETSDVHGYLAEKNGDQYQYLLSYISDKVKDVRGYGEAYDRDSALLLDGGDIFQGSSLSNLLGGKSISSAYAMMDYDAVTIGNHEFDWGITTVIDSDGTMMDSTLEGFETENLVPFVASNLYLHDSRPEWLNDYVIITKNAKNSEGQLLPVRIGVIGYLDEYLHSIMDSKFIGLGYSIKEDPGIPNQIAKELEESGNVDATILLCHADAMETAESLGADSVIDLVLGGHTHDSENGTASNAIPYMEPNKYGSALCRADLVFEADGQAAVFQTVSNAEIISVSDHPDQTINTAENAAELDPDMVKLTDHVLDAIADILNQKVGYITASAKKKGYLEGSGKLSTTGGSWMSSIYMRATDSDAAFTNYGGVRYDFELAPGEAARDVTLGEIYSTYPFETHLYQYCLSYEELLSVFNYGLKDPEHRAITSLVGLDCYFANDEVNALVKDGTLIYQDGVWKGDWKEKTVTVATNEYVGTSDEMFQGMHNPLVQFNDTPKLVEHEKIDIDCAIEVLTKEASENNGLLTIDTAPHFIEGTYDAIPAPCDGGSSCPSIQFSDVDRSPTNWYHEAVDWACVSGVTKGLSETQFGPTAACTRAQAVTFLWRAKGCPEPKSTNNPFTDVKEGTYYYKAVLWANENDITNGTSAATFSPESPCTRAHVVTFLWRTANKPAAGDSSSFKDVPSGQYYTDAVLWAVNHNPQITNGTGKDTFSPESSCTRGQIVTFLYRYMK